MQYFPHGQMKYEKPDGMLDKSENSFISFSILLSLILWDNWNFNVEKELITCMIINFYGKYIETVLSSVFSMHEIIDNHMRNVKIMTFFSLDIIILSPVYSILNEYTNL